MDLSSILKLFNCGVNEEQAWAIMHQSSKDLFNQWSSSSSSSETESAKCATPEFESLNVTEDGCVFVKNENQCYVESEVLNTLAESVFQAISYGNEDNSPAISQSLDALISRMADLEPEVDEGYEPETEEEEQCSLSYVIKVCEQRLTNPEDADDHYTAVCRAFLTEARMLMTFLDKVTKNEEFNKNQNNNNSENEDIPDLGFVEWTRLWMQVLDKLRNGVTSLRKVERPQNPVAYELTPYEILMQDIRKRKYTLRKVTPVVNQSPSNPHDVIMEFIRNRPTLNPMADRVLRPIPPRSKSLHERLIEQIQARPVSLRHVDPPDDSPQLPRKCDITSSKSLDVIRINPSPTVTSQPNKRRLLKAPTLREIHADCSSDESDDDDVIMNTTDSIDHDDLHLSPFTRDEKSSNRSSGTSGISSGFGDVDEEFAAVRPSRTNHARTPVRRKKSTGKSATVLSPITNVSSPSSDEAPEKPSFFSRFARPTLGIRRAQSMAVRTGDASAPMTSLEQKRAEWRARRQQSKLSEVPTVTTSPLPKREKLEDLTRVFAEKPAQKNGTLRRAVSMKPKTRTPLPQIATKQAAWKYPSACLELTVDELVHIRQVLARAELEKYQSQSELYNLLKKGKICFNCRIRKFTLFAWASTCQICKQKTCSKCIRKVRAPTEEYLSAPVYSLSPSMTKDDFAHNSTESAMGDGDVMRSQVDSDRWDAARWRKLDACEDCRDLIANIIQNNQLATIHNGNLPAHCDIGMTSSYSFLTQCVSAKGSPTKPTMQRSSTTYLRSAVK